MATVWHGFVENMAAFLDSYGLLAIFVVLLVKEIGVPLPIPGDFIMLSAAAQAAAGQFILWQAFLAIVAALVVGDWVQYALVRSVGRPILYRFGRYIGLTPSRLDGASAKVGTGGPVAVALGVVTPGVRNVAIPACGLAHMPNRTFLPGLVAGSGVFVALHFVIGYVGGPVVRAALGALGVPLLALLAALLVLGFAGWLLIHRASSGDREPAAVARESARDWADACCPVCLALAAMHERVSVRPESATLPSTEPA